MADPDVDQVAAFLVELLRHTGRRLGDVTIGERSGRLHVREGKSATERTVPLNADARRAVRFRLAVPVTQRSGPDSRATLAVRSNSPLPREWGGSWHGGPPTRVRGVV